MRVTTPKWYISLSSPYPNLFSLLTNPVKLPDYSNLPTATKEDTRSAALARRAQLGDYDPALIEEQLTRTASFLGPTRFPRLRTAFVIIVGLGGVGSHAASSLARSGIAKIRLIDFDQVTLSSLNRHALATLPDVGSPKVECVRKRLQAVVPWIEFDCRNEIFRPEAADRLLGSWSDGQKPDFIIDAIDNVDSKVALLHHCHTHSLPIVSAMGAGCKSDPARLQVGDISHTLEDPLSRSTRRRLRLLGVHSGIPVIYSTEKPSPEKAQLLPLPDEEFEAGKVNELSVLPDFRARILPVLGTMPAIFGQAVANYVILEIADYPREAIVGGKGREKMYEQILSGLLALEERLVRAEGGDAVGLKIPLNRGDVEYLVEEVYRGKSVISGLGTRLVLVRWERPERGFVVEEVVEGQKVARLKVNDLVLVTKEEAVVHEKMSLAPQEGKAKSLEDLYGAEVLAAVKKRRAEERWFERFR